MQRTNESGLPVALITGAGSGIGRATAVALAREGHAVVLVGRRAQRLNETAALLPEGVAHLCLAADVGITEDARGMVDKTVEHFGRLDVLVNNAGVAPLVPIEEHTAEMIEEVYRVNAVGPAHTVTRAWPIFQRQKRGCIVNLSTLGTFDPFPGFFAYAASKAAVNLMAKSCAMEGREHGIRAFAIAPGAVETEMLRAIVPESVIPPEQTMPPEQIAQVILECIRGERDDQNGETITLEMQ